MARRKPVSGNAKKPAADGTSRQPGRKRAASKVEPLAGADVVLPQGKLYYRIGEVAKITGVKPHVLRYWETEFRWMAPPKSRSKQRLYRRKDIEMILAIKKLLYEERYTIAGARLRLRELGLAKVLCTADGKVEPTEGESGYPSPANEAANDLRSRFRHMRDELQEIRELL